MNEEQLKAVRESSIEQIKECLDWADEVLDTFENLNDILFDESPLGQILNELTPAKKLIKQMDGFRKARNIVYEAYQMKKELTSNVRNASE